MAAYLASAEDRQVDALRCLLAAFTAQTWKNWRLLVVHDGPPTALAVVDKLTAIAGGDSRIEIAFAGERKQQFGHPHRQWAINKLRESCEYIGMTNQDNYYVPSFLEMMLGDAFGKPQADFIYCDMVHSHRSWRPVATRPQRGRLDLGAFLVRSWLCKKIMFDNFSFAGDGDYINRVVKAAKVVRKVNATLMVHN